MTCKSIQVHPNVDPGWGCCACKESGRAEGFVYNADRRNNCKVCGHLRCDTELAEDTFSTFASKHPEILAVIRPADPKAALAEIDRILQAQKDGSLPQDAIDTQYQEMIGLQEYTFVGLLDPAAPRGTRTGQQPKLLSPQTGEPIGELQPGDSFVPYQALVEMQRAATDEPVEH